MNTKQPFADLLAGLQAGKLSLVDIIGSLNARGPVQAPLHKAELAMLDAALTNKKIDDKLHRLLSAKLKDVQTGAYSVSPQELAEIQKLTNEARVMELGTLGQSLVAVGHGAISGGDAGGF